MPLQIFLLTPTRRGVNSNPGSHLITAGIKWLIRRAEPEASLAEIDLTDHDEPGWQLALDRADVIVVCGNPRLNEAPNGQYCDVGIWRSLEEARETVLGFGRFHGLTLGEVAEREPTYIDWIASTITRDRDLVMRAKVIASDLDARGVERRARTAGV